MNTTEKDEGINEVSKIRVHKRPVSGAMHLRGS